MAPRYTTLGAVKDQLGITDSGQDTDLTTALLAAEQAIDDHCRRRFDPVDPDADPSTQRKYDVGWCRQFDVDDVRKVDAIDIRRSPTDDWSSVDISSLELLPHNNDADGRPYTRLRLDVTLFGTVRVTGWFGWPSVPDTVAEAAILQACRLHERKGATLGVQTVVSTEGTGMRLLAKLDADVEQLLTGVLRDPVLI